jgi:hypothetical protein
VNFGELKHISLYLFYICVAQFKHRSLKILLVLASVRLCLKSNIKLLPWIGSGNAGDFVYSRNPRVNKTSYIGSQKFLGKYTDTFWSNDYRHPYFHLATEKMIIHPEESYLSKVIPNKQFAKDRL